jgi:hypothetical protein
MVQATTTLQQRIDVLDRKLTATQAEELASLVRLLGFELKPIKVAKPNRAQAWKPVTEAGRRCKRYMLMYERLGDFKGITH